MKVVHRVVLIAVSLPFALGAIACILWGIEVARSAWQESAFESITQGATRQEVVAALGKPSRERPCGENLWWGGDSRYLGKNTGQCSVEARYEYFLVAYGVGYSAKGVVVSKYKYVSE